MLAPTYSLTANERILPRLAIDFTTAVLDSRITVTRASNTATAINSSGNIAIVNANLPRFDYNPSTLICRGILIEETRTNLLLNSLINGTNLSTQSVTLSAVAYTLSFYGTGSIDISGGHTATVAGAGAYPSRKSYTFTPTAGSTTFTVTGTVQYANLEAGSYATSFIPTAGSSVVRNTDNITMTGTNFSSWFNQDTGTFSATVDILPSNGNNYAVRAAGGTNAISIGYRESTTLMRSILTTAIVGSGITTSATAYTVTGGYSFSGNKMRGALNGTLSNAQNTTGTVGTNTTAYIGSFNGSSGLLNGRMSALRYWPQMMINNELQAFSK